MRCLAVAVFNFAWSLSLFGPHEILHFMTGNIFSPVRAELAAQLWMSATA
jgi:hypothetical protein